MEQSTSEVSGSNSAQFRSRATAAVSQRRLNASASQTRELSSISPVNERSSPISLQESPPTYDGTFIWSALLSIMRRRWLFHLFAMVCTINFTYDMVFGKWSLFMSEATHKYHLSPLDSLSQPFRISRIADLHDPKKFEPFVISPAQTNGTVLNITACLCIVPEHLEDVARYTVDWPGFLSIVLVHPDNSSASARRALKGQLRSLSQHRILRQRLYLHLFEHPKKIKPPFNSLINLARFYAPTEPNLLVPSLPHLPALSKHHTATGDYLDSLKNPR